MRTLPLLPLVLLLAAPASATESKTCLQGQTPSGRPSALGRVTGKAGEKAFFYTSDNFSGNGCPEKGGCQTRAYVIPGNEVLVAQAREGWVCALYAGRKGQTIGWLKTAQVDVLPAGSPALAAWTGTWRDGETSLAIAAGHGEQAETLELQGKAFWHGGRKGESTHVGSLKGHATPVGDQVVVPDSRDRACTVNLTLLGSYLVASDNHQCGGANVTFAGVYTKAK